MCLLVVNCYLLVRCTSAPSNVVRPHHAHYPFVNNTSWTIGMHGMNAVATVILVENRIVVLLSVIGRNAGRINYL